MTDRTRWDTLATEKGPLRAAWDEDDDKTAECLAELLPILPQTGNLLDLGCGPGRLTVPVAHTRPDAFIVGLDASPVMVAYADEPPNVCYLVGDGRHIPAFGPFDAAWSVLCFQHLTQDTILGYLNQLRTRLHQNAPFRFQYAEGGGDHFSMDEKWVRGICEGLGYWVESVDRGKVRECWTWVTVRA